MGKPETAHSQSGKHRGHVITMPTENSRVYNTYPPRDTLPQNGEANSQKYGSKCNRKLTALLK